MENAPMMVHSVRFKWPRAVLLLITSLLFPLAVCLPVVATDWPQWRGPNRDDVSTETGLLQQWPAGGPPLAWKATDLGAGHAGVSVAGGRVFTMGDREGGGFAIALDESNGKLLWKEKIGRAGEDPPGPRGTPTVDGDKVYVLGQFGDLVCFQAALGTEVWRKNLADEFGGKCGGWRYSESPLVDGDKVVCTPGSPRGSIVALNKQTGALLWQTRDIADAAEYSSPLVEQIGGVRQYIQLTGKHVFGVDAATGKVLWSAPRRGSTATIPTPIFHDNSVYVSSGYGVGCNLFQITKPGDEFKAEQLYANKVMVNHHGGVVLNGNYLYGYSDGKGWVCQEFATGKLVWSNPGVGKGSLTCAGGNLYLRGESGKGSLALVEAKPGGYKEKGRFDQPDRSPENSWPHPVVANGKLYIRDQDVLLCFDVAKK
jgi:outer membrane protein assembly factor BamB